MKKMQEQKKEVCGTRVCGKKQTWCVQALTVPEALGGLADDVNVARIVAIVRF